MIRLLVAEDHAGLRGKMVSILEVEFSVVGSVGDGQEMLDAESRIKPDVVILDISMPTMDGIEAATRLKQRDSKARIIFLTMHDEPEFLQAALAIGALGYVIKSRLASDLRLAVREAMADRRFVSPSLRLEPSADNYKNKCI
jgi:DNA-binding NarL/FixJ family response regulator